MNTITINGNIMYNPCVDEDSRGNTVVRFSIASSRKFDKREWDYFNCYAEGKMAELINRIVENSDRVTISGRVEFSHLFSKSGKNPVYGIMVESFEKICSNPDANGEDYEDD